jgi:8-oxo-dGTP diphosphatase
VVDRRFGFSPRRYGNATSNSKFAIAFEASWAIPGGALAYSETPVEAALREFHEEIGLLLPPERVVQIHEDDHGGWSYWTVVLDVDEPFPLPTNTNWETAEVRWAGEEQLHELALLQPFRATMVRLGFLPG